MEKMKERRGEKVSEKEERISRENWGKNSQKEM